MFEKQLEQLAEIQERYPFVVLSIILLVTVFFFFNALFLQTNSSFDTLYGQESDHYQLKTQVANEFGQTDSLYVLVTLNDETSDTSRIQDIREPEVLEAMHRLKQGLLEEKSISSVFSISDVLLDVYGRLPETLEESKEMIGNIPGDVYGQLVSTDFSAANMFVDINIANKVGSLERSEAATREKIEEAAIPVGVKIVLAGEPVLINRIITLLITDNIRTIFIAIAAIFLLLMIFFRSAVYGFLGVFPVLLALTWLAGTLVLVDIQITMMTAAVGAMLVGMGVDYSIHMVHGFKHRTEEGDQDSTKGTVSEVGGALFASAMTTLAGFIAMTFGTSPSSQDQGFILSLGIVYAFLATMVVLPALLVVYRKLSYTDLDQILFRVGPRKKEKEGVVAKVLGRLAHLQVRRPWLIMGAFFLITFLILPGMGFVRMDTSNDNWIPPGDPTMEALDEIGSKFGGLESQNFLITLDPENDDPNVPHDLRDPGVLKKVAELDRTLESHSHIDTVDSPTDTILANNNGKIPNTIEEVKNIIEDHPEIEEDFNRDFSVMIVTARGDSFGDQNSMRDNYYEWLKEADTISFPEGVSVQGQGGIRSDIELDTLLATDTMFTTGLGFVLVFLISWTIYSSFVVGFLAVFPIIFSLLWTVGIMGYVDLPFTVLTSGMMAIVMGMGVDFSIHLIHHAKLLLGRGIDIAQAIPEAVKSTGSTILTATQTTVLGFCSLLLATLLATQRLGLTLAIAIGSCFIICMVLVPTTLVIEHKIKNRKRGLKE